MSQLAEKAQQRKTSDDDAQRSAAATSAVDAVGEVMTSSVNRLVDDIVGALYPGAAFQRSSLALDALRCIVSEFPHDERDVWWRHSFVDRRAALDVDKKTLFVFTPRVASALLTMLWDSYDAARDTGALDFATLCALSLILTRARSTVFAILKAFPTPLPGFESRELGERLLDWSLRMSVTLRAREASVAGTVLVRRVSLAVVLR